MAKLLRHTGNVWQFDSEQEATLAQMLSDGNVKFLETQLALEKQKRDNLVPNPNNYAAFIQQHAECTGAISMLQFLLDAHEEAANKFAIGARSSDSSSQPAN